MIADACHLPLEPLLAGRAAHGRGRCVAEPSLCAAPVLPRRPLRLPTDLSTFLPLATPGCVLEEDPRHLPIPPRGGQILSASDCGCNHTCPLQRVVHVSAPVLRQTTRRLARFEPRPVFLLPVLPARRPRAGAARRRRAASDVSNEGLPLTRSRRIQSVQDSDATLVTLTTFSSSTAGSIRRVVLVATRVHRGCS